MGRNVLFLLGKAFSLTLVAGAAALAGGLVYLLVGLAARPLPGAGEMMQWACALAAAWMAVAVCAAALVPVVAKAFVAFDVARDTRLDAYSLAGDPGSRPRSDKKVLSQERIRTRSAVCQK